MFYLDSYDAQGYRKLVAVAIILGIVIVALVIFILTRPAPSVVLRVANSTITDENNTQIISVYMKNPTDTPMYVDHIVIGKSSYIDRLEFCKGINASYIGNITINRQAYCAGLLDFNDYYEFVYGEADAKSFNHPWNGIIPPGAESKITEIGIKMPMPVHFHITMKLNFTVVTTDDKKFNKSLEMYYVPPAAPESKLA